MSSRQLVLIGLLGAFCLGRGSISLGEETPPDAIQRIRSRLEARVAADPGDASSWRLLGRLRLKEGDEEGALAAFRQAIRLAPDNAATHYDLGWLLIDRGQFETAAGHLVEVTRLAPNSHYAMQVWQEFDRLPSSAAEEIVQAGYEVKRFDGSDQFTFDDADNLQEPADRRPYHLWVEAGVLYNTNVALTPISRELFPGTRDSLQGTLSGELEYYVVDDDVWRAGPVLAGDFQMNEGNFRELNLQSYRPGMFVERTQLVGSAIVVPRVQYDFTHDAFDGTTFGNRHAATASAATLWDDGDVSFVYAAADFTDFVDDGDLPVFSSRDGWTYTLGTSHLVAIERDRVRSFRVGADVQKADTDGSDFRYNGVSVYGELEVECAPTITLLTRGGWGYRDYPDFDLTPSRNENIWQAGAELKKQITPWWSLSIVFSYQRFASDNELFEAERTIGGTVATFEY